MGTMPFSRSWEHVERAVFDYLVQATGAEEGVNAFRPWDWPRELVSPGSDFAQWSFQISGGDTIIPNEFGQIPGGCHHPQAEIVVRAGAESAAMEWAGKLFAAIHGAGTEQIACIQKAYATSYPQKGRAVRPLKVTAGSIQEEVIASEITIPLRIAFGRIEES